MNDRLQVLHVDTGREDRGGQRQVGLLIEGQLAHGAAVGLACPPGSPLASRLAGWRGLSLFAVDFRGEWSLPALWQLRRVLNAQRPRVVHAHTAHAISVAHLARRGREARLVAHRRVDYPLRRHPLARLKARWPDRWIAVADSVRDQLVRDGIDPSAITVVESAIDPRRLTPQRTRAAVRAEFDVPLDAPVIVAVGELVAQKGHGVLVDALSQLPELFAWIVGEGALRGALAAKIESARMGQRVRLTGARDDVADLLAAADLFGFPSIHGEGSPAALKEALFVGLPVLASDHPAHLALGLRADELVARGEVAAWAAALRRALQRPLAPQARAAQSARAARFLPERLLTATEDCYRALLSGPTCDPG